MKKIVYLMLTLLMLSAAGANAQVTIGSLDNPHPGAVLDLRSNAQGLLLPTVSLNDVSVFQLAADTTRATGMTVYNTNPAIGAGLYIWDGKKWKQIGAGGFIGCSDIPEVPGEITFSATSVETNAPFTAEVPAVTGNNAPTSYNWYLPTGLSGTSTGRIIAITAITAKTYDAGTIKVTATNDCGTSAEQSSTKAVVVTQAVGPGETIVVGSNAYATYCYPGAVGCWMIQNSKEGTPSYTQYEGKQAGERGYYYTWNQALIACPRGWSVPTQAQWNTLATYINGQATSNEKGHWFATEAQAGGWDTLGWNAWGEGGLWWSCTDTGQPVFADTQTSQMTIRTGATSWANTVRCIKD